MGKFSDRIGKNNRKSKQINYLVPGIVMAVVAICALSIIITSRNRQRQAVQTRDFTPAPKMTHLRTSWTDRNDQSCHTLDKMYPKLHTEQAHKVHRKKYAVVTYSDGQGSKQEHFCKVRANHCAYAEMQERTDCIDNRNLQMCVDPVSLQTFHLIHPSGWAKVSLMQHCCKHYEFLFMADSDMLFMDPKTYPFDRFIKASAKQDWDIMVPGSTEANKPFGTGFIAVRCPSKKAAPGKPSFVREFLAGAMNLSHQIEFQTSDAGEQLAMNKLYKELGNLRKKVFIINPPRLTQCNASAGDCSLNDFTVRFSNGSGYLKEFLRYFCQSRTNSATTQGMNELVCSS